MQQTVYTTEKKICAVHTAYNYALGIQSHLYQYKHDNMNAMTKKLHIHKTV